MLRMTMQRKLIKQVGIPSHKKYELLSPFLIHRTRIFSKLQIQASNNIFELQ